jgi:hypothetical protein
MGDIEKLLLIRQNKITNRFSRFRKNIIKPPPKTKPPKIIKKKQIRINRKQIRDKNKQKNYDRTYYIKNSRKVLGRYYKNRDIILKRNNFKTNCKYCDSMIKYSYLKEHYKSKKCLKLKAVIDYYISLSI